MDPLFFILGCLATFRLATMVAKEKGPWDIFKTLRDIPRGGTVLDYFMSCPLCQSVYFALIMCITLWPGIDLSSLIVHTLAMSGVSVCLSLQFTTDL